MASQKENNLLQMSKTKKQKCEKNIYLSFEKTDEIKKYLKEEKICYKNLQKSRK
jgi:hypothetical protein